MTKAAGSISLLLLAAIGSEAAGGQHDKATPSPHHDPSVVELVKWGPRNGIYYNPKQEIRHAVPGDESTVLGVFATETIEEGELLCSVPWNSTINAGREVDPEHMVCDTVRNLVKEMRLGDQSDYAPYVKYLLEQRRGQIPSGWSDAGKGLLWRVLDGGALPPAEPMNVLTEEWHQGCDGSDDPFEENAAMLVVQRCEDDLMLPFYDFYNHRNGNYLNTINYRREMESFDVNAARTIQPGEQIFNSYNMCNTCGGRAEAFGTPEIFSDYGFVEAMPQRWIFWEQRIRFELKEKNNGSGELELKWLRKGRPKNKKRRKKAANTFRQHIQRLARLKKMEHMKRNTEIPEYEWDMIWSYSEALITAMTYAIKEVDGDIDDCEGIDKSCIFSDGYDALESDESDDFFYDAIPPNGYYQSTCDNYEEMMFDGRHTLDEPKSLYSEISFFETPNGNACLELDTVIQICDTYRPHYHEIMLDFPARYIDSVRRVLFVGGGDSMLLAEALKYPNIELVVGLELDQVVVRKSFIWFLTLPHFDDKRVEWWFGDAVKSLRLLPREYFGSFDLVLVDLSETVASFTVTEHLDMIEALGLLVKPEGIMVKNEWTYLNKMSTIFENTARINMQDVPHICDQALTMGSNTVDFLRHKPTNHNISRLLLGPYDQIDNRYYMFHDIQKNNIKNPSTCPVSGIESEENGSRMEERAGILMIVNAEDVGLEQVPIDNLEQVLRDSLSHEGLNVHLTLHSPSNNGGVFIVIILEEGYITVRTWPDKNYCALDIQLWVHFGKIDGIRDALVGAVGGNDESLSSYKIVTGGMLGTGSWEDELKVIGPPNTCSSSVPAELDDSIEHISSKQLPIGPLLKESTSLIQHKEGLYLIICGVKGEQCDSLEVLSTVQAQGNIVTLWTCPNISGEDQYAENISDHMIACEKETIDDLTSAYQEDRRFGAIVVDHSVPLTMIKIMNSVVRMGCGGEWCREQTEDPQVRLLSNHALILAFITDSSEEVRTRKHNFLDRVRKELGEDPLFRAEIVMKNTHNEGVQMEVGIISEDEDFFSKLYNITRNVEVTAGLDIEVRKILGARLKPQNDYNPRFFRLEDYDPEPGKKQYSEQSPIGRQSLFQLKVKAGQEISRLPIQNALLVACSTVNHQVNEVRTITEIGSGIISSALSPEGSAILVWDGNSRVDINLFSFDDKEENANAFLEVLTTKLNMDVVQRDEQPRGTGRVINFLSDIKNTPLLEQEQEKQTGPSKEDGKEYPSAGTRNDYDGDEF